MARPSEQTTKAVMKSMVDSDAPDAPFKVSPIADAQEALWVQLARLQEAVHRMNEKLRPVSLPIPEEANVKGAQIAPTKSEMLSTIHNQTESLRDSVDSIHYQLDCLEI